MKAHVEFSWSAGHMDEMAVWLWQPAVGGGRAWMRFVDGQAQFVDGPRDPEYNAPVDPTLRLPREALEALVAAASEKLPPADATVDGLKDARQVRDRLLTMVEKLTS